MKLHFGLCSDSEDIPSVLLAWILVDALLKPCVELVVLTVIEMMLVRLCWQLVN